MSAAQDGDEANGTATLTHTVTSTGTDFNSSLTIASVSATEDDDDTPGVMVSTTSLTVPEGGSATYTIVLDTQPTGNVEITATPHSQSDTSLTTSGSLSFGTTNWNTAQTVTVSAAQDNDNVNGTALINHTALSADTDYGGITIASVTATEADDDAGVTLSRTSVAVTEGSTATYTVVLDTAPSANVTIAVAKQTGGDADLTVSPASLTFTNLNYNSAQTVTVSASQDADTVDGSAVITHTATSTDSNYGGITISNVTATEDDDDTAPASADVTLAVSRDNRTAIPLSRFPFSDADGGTLRGVKIVTLPGAVSGHAGAGEDRHLRRRRHHRPVRRHHRCDRCRPGGPQRREQRPVLLPEGRLHPRHLPVPGNRQPGPRLRPDLHRHSGRPAGPGYRPGGGGR